MISTETKELAQLAYDAYFERIGIEKIQLDEIPPKVRDAWIASVAAIKAEVEKKYAGCLVAGEPSAVEPEQTSEETSIPCGYILLPKAGGSPLYIRATDITAISGGSADKNMCWVYSGNDAFKCMLSAITVGFMITEIIGANRRVNSALTIQ